MKIEQVSTFRVPVFKPVPVYRVLLSICFILRFVPCADLPLPEFVPVSFLLVVFKFRSCYLSRSHNFLRMKGNVSPPVTHRASGKNENNNSNNDFFPFFKAHKQAESQNQQDDDDANQVGR